MPNWFMNKITLLNMSKDENKITQMLKDIKNEDALKKLGAEIDSMPEDELVTTYPTIDFNKVIPMPEALAIESGSSSENGLNWWLYANRRTIPAAERMEPELSDEDYKKVLEFPKWTKYEKVAEDELNKIISYGKDPKIVDIGTKAAHNIIEYNAPTWYEWRYDNWGTKWNANETQFTKSPNEIMFTTAWSPVIPIACELSRKYTDVLVTIAGADESFPEICEPIMFLNGEEIESISEVDNPEQFWADIWGYDDEQMIDIAGWTEAYDTGESEE